MRRLIIIFLLCLMVAAPATSVYAMGVAEASTGNDRIYANQYDLSGLSDEEKKWFVTFLKGTFFAEGWQDISNDILIRISSEEREKKKVVLKDLGNKIGREWCKDNNVRRINTSMLRKWGHQLRLTAAEKPDLLAEVLRDINGEVESLLD